VVQVSSVSGAAGRRPEVTVSGPGGQPTELEQLQAKQPDLGKHAGQRRLVGEAGVQHRPRWLGGHGEFLLHRQQCGVTVAAPDPELVPNFSRDLRSSTWAAAPARSSPSATVARRRMSRHHPDQVNSLRTGG